MDHLWSPWRYRYVQRAHDSGECIFCQKAAENRDDENLIVHRAARNFILLNLFPYTTGHLMIAPYEHVATLEAAADETLSELMLLTKQAEHRLRTIYRPQGFNIGMNIGEMAGAGIAGHIHMHVVPRWTGDANFMSTVGETRVMPEELPETYRKVKDAFSLGV
jgi:ATP adenylyltransferase